MLFVDGSVCACATFQAAQTVSTTSEQRKIHPPRDSRTSSFLFHMEMFVFPPRGLHLPL